MNLRAAQRAASIAKVVNTMTELALSIGEPFTSPAWESNFVVFAGESGNPIPEQHTKDYLRRCCKYAAHYEAWLVPERFILLGYQCMGLVSPQGKVVGAQRGVFDGPVFHRQAERSTAAEVFPTEHGGVFLCVDTDVYRPEVARIAAGMGAQIIVCSQTIGKDDYASHMVLTGAWNAAQLAGCYVIAVSNQFSCVSAPTQLTQQRDGFLSPPSLKKPMTQRFNVDKLAELRRPKPLSQKFYDLHREELIG